MSKAESFGYVTRLCHMEQEITPVSLLYSMMYRRWREQALPPVHNPPILLLYCTQCTHFQVVCVVYFQFMFSYYINICLLASYLFMLVISCWVILALKSMISVTLPQFCYLVLGKITRLGARWRSLARRGGFHDLSLVTVLT